MFSYIIYVEADEDVHYTITAGPRDKEIVLKEGLSHVDRLEAGEVQEYAFYS